MTHQFDHLIFNSGGWTRNNFTKLKENWLVISLFDYSYIASVCLVLEYFIALGKK